MSQLRRLAKSLTTVEPFTNLSGPRPRFGRTRAGVDVSTDRAMRHAAVWACVRNRAEDIAKMPVRVIEYQGNTRVRKELPTWLLKPNSETTTFELFERTTASMDTDGTGFWWVGKDRLGRVGEVWPLPPAQVEVWRDPPKPGQVGVNPKRYRFGGDEFSADEIVQFTGFSLPGRLRGLSPIQQHMHALGLSIAAEEYGESFFGNGAVMSGIVVLPTPADAKQVEEIKDGIARDHQGLENAHRPGVLTGGAKWEQLSIPNNDAQFLETRKYQLAEITRIYRMPSHKVNDLDHATFSNIEHIGIEYVTDGLLPTFTRIEATVQAAGLLGPGEHLKFNPAVLLKGDTAARYAAYAIGIQWGWLCPDDVRELEDLNPLPDGAGQNYLRPLNMVPATAHFVDQQAAAPAPAPLPSPEG